MDQTTFENLVREIEKESERTLELKKTHYAKEEDRLQNFKQVGDFLGVSASKVCLCYLLKHIQALQQAIEEGKIEWSLGTAQEEKHKQRIIDSHNYILLLGGCMYEEVLTQIQKEEDDEYLLH